MRCCFVILYFVLFCSVLFVFVCFVFDCFLEKNYLRRWMAHGGGADLKHGAAYGIATGSFLEIIDSFVEPFLQIHVFSEQFHFDFLS